MGQCEWHRQSFIPEQTLRSVDQCDPAKITAQKLDEIITFLSHTPYFAISISTCDAGPNLRFSLKINWRKRVRVERTGDIRDAARRF